MNRIKQIVKALPRIANAIVELIESIQSINEKNEVDEKSPVEGV